MGKIGTDILLGTCLAATVNKAIIFRWDTWSVSFTGIDEVDEVGINAFLPSDNDNLVFVQWDCGKLFIGTMGEIRILYKKFPSGCILLPIPGSLSFFSQQS